MNTHLYFKLFFEWQISSAQASMFLPFGVILVLKLSGMERGQSHTLVSIEDLESDQ